MPNRRYPVDAMAHFHEGRLAVGTGDGNGTPTIIVRRRREREH